MARPKWKWWLPLTVAAIISICLELQQATTAPSSETPSSSSSRGSRGEPEVKRMRILALFSGTRNELGLDHRLGRQVLKLAVARAKQLHPELGQVELVIYSDDSDCSGLNEIPNRVVEQFYSISGNANQQHECSLSSTKDNDDYDHNRQMPVNCKNSNETMVRMERRWQATEAMQPKREFSFGSHLGSRPPSSPQPPKIFDAIIGPSCDHLVDLVARMAAYWRTPIYSVASVGAAFGRKDIYSTLTRLSPSIDHLSTFVVKTMERFKWRHLAIIIDQRQVENRIIWENLDRTIIRLKYAIPIDRKLIEFRVSEGAKPGPEVSLCSLEAKTTLLEARRVARVFLFLISDHQLIRRLLLCAHELKMANGEFVFLAIDMGLKSAGGLDATTLPAPEAAAVATANNSRQQEEATSGAAPMPSAAKLSMATRTAQSLDWYLADDEVNNMIAKKIFESLMVFSVELPISDEFSLFVEQTLDMAQQEFPGSRFERSSVGQLAVALHDCLLLAVEAHAKRAAANSSSSPMRGFDSQDDDDDGDENDGELDQPVNRRGEPPALMWNERYSSGLIASMHINSNGDQELDYVLNDLEPEMGLMRPVARYAKETRQIEPLAGSYVHWPARPQAPGGERPPPDEPECGFNDDAERCIDRQNLYAALSIVSILVLLVLASAFVSLRKYRRIKYQMQLDDYWWKINWSDLQFIQTTDSLVSSNPQSVARALRSGGSVVSSQASGSVISVALATKRKRLPHSNPPPKAGTETNRGSSRKVPLIVTSNMDATTQPEAANDQRSLGSASEVGSSHHGRSVVASTLKGGSELCPSGVFIRSDYSSVVRASNLAMYKNELVIVKQLNCKTNLEVSHDLLVDLRSMREHLQENLAKFVGLCVEPERLAIVYEYCSRGSLQDMLLNESIAIDWTLKSSIIGDILNGLNFIHTTLLNYHGRLKSTNLVLDSRFTVKITDFGLQNLYSQLDILDYKANEDSDDDGDSDYHESDRRKGSGQQPEDRLKLELQRDTLSLSVSQRAIGGPNPRSSDAGGSRANQRGNKRMKMKNRGAARYFWTAPEHLRIKDSQSAGSRKGDVYSLAIILFELLTRREPYYYGTNAKPHLATINKEKREMGAAQPGAATGQHRLSASGLAHRPSMASTNLASSVGRRAQSRLRRVSASVGPLQHSEQVAGDTGSSVSNQSGQSHGSGQSQLPAAVNNQQKKQNHKQHSRNLGHASVVAIDEEMESEVNNRNSTIEPSNAGTATDEPIDADEILDQLRMGLQPEPVRPYVPNFVLHELNPSMVELMRECWNESPQARPTLVQIRNRMRKLTKGMASRNYLDNLLERLQNYAADLERIVDAKSSDIVAEKFRTEEILYQLVPKFVAERLNSNEPIVPQVFDGVTIFFSDIVGFEKYASVMSPSDLVDLLNSIYSSFESVITSFDVTKIETIIDQFLIASGISLEPQQAPSVANINQQQQQQQITTSRQSKGQENSEQQQQPAGGATKSRRAKLLGSLRHTYGSSDNKNQSLDIPAVTNNENQQQDPTGMATSNGRGGDKSHYKRSSAEQIARMALCLRDQMKSFYFRGSSSSGGNGDAASSGAPETVRVTKTVAANFNLRIGIHSGKVCAGIIGVKRPKYCLIGDTVNVASRMHTNSKANKIQISVDTKELLAQVPGFSIEPRGKIEVKGKGVMETYWLESSF